MKTLALAVLLLWPGVAAAQSQTGAITGDVTDQDGAPIPGARVVVNSPTQIGGDRAVTTDPNGHFVILNLTPGLFTVRASKTGLSPYRQENVRVSLGGTAELFIILEVATAREDIVVHVERPAVDVQSHRVGTSISSETMERAPVAGRSYQSVVGGLTPGVRGTPNPNNPSQNNPSIRGGADFNNSYSVDGISITDPVSHTFGTNFNFDAMSDVEVLTAGYGPEYALTSGGVINIITRSGSNDFHLDASSYLQSNHLTLLGPDEQGQVFHSTSVNLNASGPIVRDRLWFFGSFQYDDNADSLPADPTGILPPHPARRFVGPEYLGKLNWQATDRLQLIAVFQGEAHSISNNQRSIFVEPDAERHQDQYTGALSLEGRYSVSPTALWRTQLAFSRTVLDLYPESGDRSTPGYDIDVVTGVATTNDIVTRYDRRMTLQLNSDVTQYLTGLGGEHQLRYGIKVQHAWNPVREGHPGSVVFQRRNGVDFARTQYCIEFDPDTLTCTPGSLETTTTGQTGLLFLQDGFSPSFYRNVTLTPGLGLELGHTANSAGDTISQFLTATAHLNLTWRPTGDAKTVIRGGYNQYVDMGFLGIPGFVGKSLFSRRCEVDETARDAGARDPYVANCLNGGGDAGVTVGYPNGPPTDTEGNVTDTTNPDALTAPRTHELYIGGERELFSGLVVGTDLVWRSYVHQFEDVETNIEWNALGNDAARFRNGKSEFVFDLETPEEAHRTHTSWSLFVKRFADDGSWWTMASYTYARNFGTVDEGFATQFLDDYQQNKFYYGPLPSDVRHDLSLVGGVRLFRQLSISASFDVVSGAPYSRLYLNDLYLQFQDRRAPRGQDPRSLSNIDDDVELRYPTRATLDLLILYELKELFGVDGTLSCSIENVFNNRMPTRIEDRETGPDAPTHFGDVLDRLDPLQVNLGMRFRY